MISTKSLVSTVTSVPRHWVFEYYLKLKEPLSGQDVKIKSPFNEDKNPSFCIYFSAKTNYYRFKDFSTGVNGDGIELVQRLFQLTTRGESAHKIMEDYNRYMFTNNNAQKVRQFKIHQKYKIKDLVKRQWTNFDGKYWTSYHINSKLLEHYNVVPIDNYTLYKEEDDGPHTCIINGNFIYGYYRNDGMLYKIYQPMVKDHKFMKVANYIQGTDQLKMDVPNLVICSSLKDIMGFMKLGYKTIEAIAPDSENSGIPESVITLYKNKYENIFTLFDNDKAGRESAQKYVEKYQIPAVALDMSKDLTDSMKIHGINAVRNVLSPLIKNAICQEKNVLQSV